MMQGRVWLTVLATSVLMVAPVRAQEPEFQVLGTVADSVGAPLQNAMVVALTRSDSTLVKFALTNGDGRFALRDLPAGEYILQVTLVGYEMLRQGFAVADADVQTGTVTLGVSAVEMDELIVRIDQVPFINRRDTLTFNVAAFETRPNATVEELLERLPGVEVDGDGTITAQGEEVQQVLVDGKEFFSSDPTIATRNLPADAIEKVEVYDKESDMAEFTGIPDGEERLTINLGLREDARRGYFGTVAGGLGGDVDNQGLGGGAGVPASDEMRLNESFNLSRFSPRTQLAVIGNYNNVNESRFSLGNLASFQGGRGGLRGGGGDGGLRGGGGANAGFTESLSVGMNGSQDFGESSWLRGSYLLSDINNLQNQTAQQQALFGSDVTSLIDEVSNDDTDNTAHRLNLNGQFTLGEGHDLRLRTNINVSNSALVSFSNRETTTADGDLLNSAETNYLVDGDNWGGNGQLTWRKRLSANGRSLVAELRSSVSDNDLASDLNSLIEQDGRNGLTEQEILQDQTRNGRQWNQTVRLSLTQPLGSGKMLEVFGQRTSVDEDQDNSVFDIVRDEPVYNAGLSSGFERTYTYLRGGARFNRNSETSRFVLGFQVQSSDLDGTILGRDETITNGYTHFLPSMDFRWQVTDAQNLNLRYNTSTREPSLTELQPFADNINPLNIYVGNPDLQPQYTHRVRGDYRFFDQFSFLNVFAFGGYNYTQDAIAQSRVFDEQGRQTRSPVNTGGAWSTNGGITFGTPIRRLGVEVGAEYRATYAESTEFINLDENLSQILQNSILMRVENRVKDDFDVRVSARYAFNDVDYSLNNELDQSYVNSTYTMDGTWYVSDAWTLGSNLNYRIFGDRQITSGENIAHWDAYVSRFIMNNRGSIELRMYDLLNQSQGVNISSTANTIQETRTESLGQYLMLRVNMRVGRVGRGQGRGGSRRRQPRR